MGWEKQTGRYLKAGSKGIGVVDMNNPKATLVYYFDLADTRGDYEGFRRAMSAVWSLERQYQPFWKSGTVYGTWVLYLRHSKTGIVRDT